jgi:hypothetical protein
LSAPGCQSQQATSGIEISVPPLASIASVDAAFRKGHDTETTTLPLEQKDGRWMVSLDGLDFSADYEVVATGRDTSGNAVSSSNTVDATLEEGRTSQMLIALQATGAENAGDASSQLVDALWASAKKVNTGETVALSVWAHDVDPSSALTFEWSAGCGKFSAKNIAATTWLAPSHDDLCDLKVVIRDSGGRWASAGLQVQVGVGNGTGRAVVEIFINAAPQVTAMTASPGPIENGSAVQFLVSANDPDGDKLSYQWTSTCPGAFDNPTQAATKFLPALTTGATTCSFSVAVGDGRGGVGNGTLVLSTSKPAVYVAPAMGLTYQSPDAPEAGDVVIFHAEASNPEGQSLTWRWSANAGTFTAETDQAGSSEIRWTAPEAKHVPCSIVVTATDPQGESAAYVFAVRT